MELSWGRRLKTWLNVCFSSLPFWVAVGFISLCLSILFPAFGSELAYSNRFGALMIASGVILLARPSFVGFPIQPAVLDLETGLDCTRREHFEKTGAAVPPVVAENELNHAAVGVWGPAFVLVGTVINGWGDLILGLFK
jgi:hypothetical protein